MSLSNEELGKYWDAANTLREDLDAAEYKHIVLGLVFLKFISDAFSERREELTAEFANPKSDNYKKDEKARAIALDERDYYLMENVFWVPEKARWDILQQNSKQPNIAKQIDDALFAIEKDNSKLEGIVERSYAASKLPVEKLGQVLDLIGQISFDGGRREASDILGQVYEYFLGKFASAEGKLGGQFYTTPSIVKTIVEVLKPTKGRIYDPACGSGGMFVQSERFAEAHGGRLGDISIYGQESNPTTRRLCAMNLAIRGIEFNLGRTAISTFKDDQHKDVKFDYIMMNPPFGKNASYPKKDLLDDVRWKKYGIPREKPANYAWISHAIHHLAPKGRAGIVMPRGAVTSAQDTDGIIRTALLDDDIVECIIDLPGQLFFNVQIPATLWFFNFDKNQDDPLFHTQEGTFLRNTNFTRRVFIPALKAAEVKKIRIHDLRHTAASIAISAGATPNMVKEMLGHSDVQLTMRVYAHIFEADREKVAANVNRAVNEVHEMCTDSLETQIRSHSNESINPSDLRFFLQTGNQVDSGTSDYEFRALTN